MIEFTTNLTKTLWKKDVKGSGHYWHKWKSWKLLAWQPLCEYICFKIRRAFPITLSTHENSPSDTVKIHPSWLKISTWSGHANKRCWSLRTCPGSKVTMRLGARLLNCCWGGVGGLCWRQKGVDCKLVVLGLELNLTLLGIASLLVSSSIRQGEVTFGSCKQELESCVWFVKNHVHSTWIPPYVLQPSLR